MKRFLALIFCLLLFTVPASGADFTTAKDSVMDWTLLDDTGAVPFLDNAVLVTDTWLGAQLFIDVAHIDADAGTSATVKIWKKSGTTDEDWNLTQELSVTMGAANTGDVDQVCASAQPNVYLAATANFDSSGNVFFLRDINTLADSCLVIVGDVATDDYTVGIDNLVNAYDADDVTWDVVDQWQPILSPGFTYKVTFHNTDSAANYACRVRYSADTDIE